MLNYRQKRVLDKMGMALVSKSINYKENSIVRFLLSFRRRRNPSQNHKGSPRSWMIYGLSDPDFDREEIPKKIISAMDK